MSMAAKSLLSRQAASDLQSDRMPGFETRGHARAYLPPGRPSISRVVPRRGIESQPGNDGERVALARIDRYPFATAAFAEDAELG